MKPLVVLPGNRRSFLYQPVNASAAVAFKFDSNGRYRLSALGHGKVLEVLLEWYFMCYSALVERDFEKLGSKFDAELWPDPFNHIEAMKQFEQDVGPAEVKRIMGLVQKPRNSRFRWPDEDDRIYPNYFTPVIVKSDGLKRIAPMRYRIRPDGSGKEVPTKYNMFNARIESLETARSWRRLIGRNHALLPVKQIFERVNRLEIGIAPTDKELLSVPAVFDHWSSPGGDIFLLICCDYPSSASGYPSSWSRSKSSITGITPGR